MSSPTTSDKVPTAKQKKQGLKQKIKIEADLLAIVLKDLWRLHKLAAQSDKHEVNILDSSDQVLHTYNLSDLDHLFKQTRERMQSLHKILNVSEKKTRVDIPYIVSDVVVGFITEALNNGKFGPSSADLAQTLKPFLEDRVMTKGVLTNLFMLYFKNEKLFGTKTDTKTGVQSDNRSEIRFDDLLEKYFGSSTNPNVGYPVPYVFTGTGNDKMLNNGTVNQSTVQYMMGRASDKTKAFNSNKFGHFNINTLLSPHNVTRTAVVNASKYLNSEDVAARYGMDRNTLETRIATLDSELASSNYSYDKLVEYLKTL